MPPWPGISGMPAASYDGSLPPASTRVNLISAERSTRLHAATLSSDIETGRTTSLGAWNAQIGVSASALASFDPMMWCDGARCLHCRTRLRVKAGPVQIALVPCRHQVKQ